MIFSPFVKQPSGIGSLSTRVTGKAPHVQKEYQLLGSAAPVHGEITSDSASADPHILSPVCQDHLPHRISLLTTRPG